VGGRPGIAIVDGRWQEHRGKWPCVSPFQQLASRFSAAGYHSPQRISTSAAESSPTLFFVPWGKTQIPEREGTLASSDHCSFVLPGQKHSARVSGRRTQEEMMDKRHVPDFSAIGAIRQKNWGQGTKVCIAEQSVTGVVWLSLSQSLLWERFWSCHLEPGRWSILRKVSCCR
jgi:hypothetical protein